MSKNYEVLNELVPKTQELHRVIFDKGYEQGRQQFIDKIRVEIERHRRKTQGIDPYDLVGDCLDIIDKYKA